MLEKYWFKYLKAGWYDMNQLCEPGPISSFLCTPFLTVKMRRWGWIWFLKSILRLTLHDKINYIWSFNTPVIFYNTVIILHHFLLKLSSQVSWVVMQWNNTATFICFSTFEGNGIDSKFVTHCKPQNNLVTG